MEKTFLKLTCKSINRQDFSCRRIFLSKSDSETMDNQEEWDSENELDNKNLSTDSVNVIQVDSSGNEDNSVGGYQLLSDFDEQEAEDSDIVTTDFLSEFDTQTKSTFLPGHERVLNAIAVAEFDKRYHQEIEVAIKASRPTSNFSLPPEDAETIQKLLQGISLSNFVFHKTD